MAARRLDEPLILPARQLAAPVAERAPLYAQQLRAAVPAGELEEAVQRDQHTVDARRAIALPEQPAAPSRRRFARRLAALQPAREGAHMEKVVLRRPLRASRRPRRPGRTGRENMRNYFLKVPEAGSILAGKTPPFGKISVQYLYISGVYIVRNRHDDKCIVFAISH